MTGGWRKVAVVGGGPAVYERNAPDEASGFGVVFSARTMSELRRNDQETHARIVAASVAVSDTELRHPRATLHFGRLVAPGSLDEADPERFGTSVRHGSSPYMWLGTHAPFDAATFAFVPASRHSPTRWNCARRLAETPVQSLLPQSSRWYSTRSDSISC